MQRDLESVEWNALDENGICCHTNSIDLDVRRLQKKRNRKHHDRSLELDVTKARNKFLQLNAIWNVRLFWTKKKSLGHGKFNKMSRDFSHSLFLIQKFTYARIIFPENLKWKMQMNAGTKQIQVV